MTDYKNSPLADPNFLKRASASQQIAEALDASKSTIAVAAREDNSYADEGFAKDLLNDTYAELQRKYGTNLANRRSKVQEEIRRQQDLENSDRSFMETLRDTGVSAAQGFFSVSGSLSALGTSLVGAEEVSTDISRGSKIVNEALEGLKTDTTQEHNKVFGIKNQLDAQDSQKQYEEDIANGDSSFMAMMRREGRNVLNVGENILEDSTVAGDIIAQALGSLGPSAKVAAGGAKLFSVFGNTGKTIGAAAGVGVSEASGTLNEVQDTVMNLSHEQLMSGSEAYKELIDSGVSPADARRRVAIDSGREAFTLQLPVATALGLISSKFEAAPIKSFKGSSLANTARTVVSQGLEEGLQGATGQISQNKAIQGNVNSSQDLLEGVGEQLATGAIAGVGMAGAIAAPSAAARTVGGTVKSFTDEGGVGNKSVKATSEASKIIAEKANEIAKPVASKAKDELAKFADRPSQEAVNEGVTSAREAVEATQEVINEDNISEKTKTQITVNQEEVIPSGLENVSEDGSTDIVSRIGNTVNKLADKTLKPNESQKAFIAAEMVKVKGILSSLPVEVKSKVQTMLKSPHLRRIERDVKETDLNKTQNEETEITKDVVSETISVAKVNPANVNPTVVNKILNESGEKISEDDLRLLQSASKIASIVNDHTGKQVEISNDQHIGLKKLGRTTNQEKITPDTVSRSIRAKGYTDIKGNALRSINDFAADIFQGAQSVDNTFTGENGVTIPVTEVVSQFSKFIKHMSNKVEALNESYNQNNEKGSGPSVTFSTLVRGTKFLPSTHKDASKVFYHRSSPNSVSTARRVAADLDAAVEVFNELHQAFPELFKNIPQAETVALLQDDGGYADANTLQEEKDAVESSTELLEPVSENVENETTEEIVKETSEVVEEPVTEDQLNLAEATSISENVHPSLNETYQIKDGDPVVSSFSDLVQKVKEEGNMNIETMSVLSKIIKPIRERMNKRLNKEVEISKKKMPLKEAIKEGLVQSFRDYKNTVIVNPETGEYDQDLLDLAVVALVDWMMIVQPRPASQIDETLENLGVVKSDLSKEQLKTALYSVPPNMVKDQLGKAILDMWNVSENVDAALIDLVGISEGVASELLTALSNFSTVIDDTKVNLIEFTELPVMKDGKEQKAQTIVVKGLSDIQKDAKEVAGNAPLTFKEYLFDEPRASYSIGEKIPSVAHKQDRSGIVLSDLEKAALKKMQDTPHYKDEGKASLFSALGSGLYRILGYIENVDDIKNDTLHKSVLGKNLSIEQDIENAFILGNKLEDGETPVYYPVGITKVGRHQYQGVNPQSNKVLRAMVTPTWSTLSFDSKEDMDAFWLGIAQASDLFKVEKRNQNEVLNTVQSEFNNRYRPAVDMVKAWLETSEIDGESFADVMGNVEPQQISAVFAVAEMEYYKAQGANDFRTSLSFELDGLTNGAANMMVNYGQGEVTKKDLGNFNRIGLFLGKVGKTINQFFEVGNKDLYEVTARAAETMLMRMYQKANPADKAKILAAGRFAAHFGDFKLTDDGSFEMTRNSAKNPMTKVNYGSGVLGVGIGIAEDMLLEFYRGIEGIPDNTDYAEYFNYPEIQKDIHTLFGDTLPTSLGEGAFEFPTFAIEDFKKNISKTIGTALTQATKNVIGDKITELNDMLVFSTNVQSQYLQMVFDEKLEELAEQRAKEGKIRRHPKTGKPVMTDLSRRDYNSVVRELDKLSPIFVSDDQSLAIGSFSKASSSMNLSANMDGKLRQGALLPYPEDVGVKAIPFSVIGSGDAMMMNLIFGSEGAPDDALGIFDGLDVPVNKVREYAPNVNEQVMKSWERDVLAMAVNNFAGFLSNVGADDPKVHEAFQIVKDKSKKSTVTATSAKELNDQLQNRHRNNKARKDVLKRIPLSVDQMGGSDVGYTRGEDEIDLGEINRQIDAELNGTPVKQEDTKIPVHITNSNALVNSIKWNKAEQAVVNVLKKVLPNVTVVLGTVSQLNDYRKENFPDNGEFVEGNGAYDTANGVIYLTTNKPETVLHELVHAATFSKVLAHYQGEAHDAVTRLEALMNEFLQKEVTSDIMREAQATILRYQAQNDVVSKAAAINEFMAYILSNHKETVKLKTKATDSLPRKVLALMERLMGKVFKNMFHHTAFNTKVLIEDPVDIDDDNNGVNNNNGPTETTPEMENHTNKWIKLAKELMAERDDQAQSLTKSRKGISTFANQAKKIIDGYRQVGMLSNAADRQTFSAIYMAMASGFQMDPQSVIGLTRLFQHIESTMTADMFNDPHEYSEVINSFGSYKTGDVSNAIAVLLALSQTSKKFRKVLNELPAPEFVEPSSREGIEGILSNVIRDGFQRVLGNVSSKDTNVLRTIDNLADSIVDLDQQKEFSVLRAVGSTLDKADAFTSGAMSQLAQRNSIRNEELKSSTRSRFVKAISNTLTLGTNLLDKSLSAETANVTKDAFHSGVPVLSLVPVRELVTEVIGSDKTNQPVIALMDEVNSRISGMRQAYREDLPGIIENLFSVAPDEEQWASMHTVLGKSDLTSFLDPSNLSKGLRLLGEKGQRQKRIAELEKALGANLSPSDYPDALLKAQQLADFMNGKGAGNLLMRNAYAIIANLEGKYFNMVPELDELITMYVIDQMDPDVRNITHQLWESEPKAMGAVITYIQGLNEEEDNKTGISEQAKLNHYKGFIPSHGKENVRIVVGDVAFTDYYEKRGYTKLDTFEGYPANRDYAYFVTSTKQGGLYSQGTMQNVQSTYKGVDINTGMSVTGRTSGFISDYNEVSDLVDSMGQSTYAMIDPKEALVPVFDEDGTVSGFEFMINPDVFNQHTQPDENTANMLGAWAGRHVEEMLAEDYNKELVDRLEKIWDERKIGDEKLFVNLKDTDDPVYAEAFRLIPAHTKNYITEKFGGEGFMVRKDMVNMSVGYREASLADVWSGKTRLPEPVQNAVKGITESIMGKKAMKWLAISEETLQGVISSAKDVIVIRSLLVPAMNTQANMLQLITRGVPTKQLIKGFRNKLAEVEEYNKNIIKKMELETQLRFTRDKNQIKILKTRIQAIDDLTARMSIAPMIEAGAYKNLSEGITDLDIEISKGRLGDIIEHAANKLPDRLADIAKIGLVSKSTQIYKVANRATQYGDFLAKSIYYDHLLNQGVSQEEALSKMNEEFVNFSLLPGRTRSYLETMGLTWFMAFKIRIMKIAMQQVRDNPVRALAVNAALPDVGSPIQDNLLPVIAEGRLDYATGYEMLFDSAGLNPWVNLLND